MTQLSRRKWLKGAGLSLAAFSLPYSGLSHEEIRKFNPRKINGPIRLSSNENPFGPSELVRNSMRQAFDIGCRYPHSYQSALIEKLAKKEGVTTDHIVLVSGSTEGLRVAGGTYGLAGGEIISAKPTFLALMTYAEEWGGTVNWVPVREDMQHDLNEMANRVSSKTKLVFVCNPNNPTSCVLPANDVKQFCETVSKQTVVFSDEAYYDFIEGPGYPSMVELVMQDYNVIVSKTFSKVYGMAGIRMGYLVAKPDIAEKLRNRVMSFPNVIALKGAETALDDSEFYKFSLRKNKEAKGIICAALDDLGLSYVQSSTNFVFFKSGRDISTLQKQMLEKGIMIGRPFPPFNDWCRISTGTLDEVNAFSKALSEVL